MAEFTNDCGGEFREAVCIDAGRVYDSCCDRDCLEDLRCYFTPEVQELIGDAISVKLRTAEVLNAYVSVEPVNFNKGYYSCDITFFFLLGFDLYTAPNACPTAINGIATYSKRVILYGGEGNVKLFSNSESEVCGDNGNQTVKTTNAPKCVVGAVDPVPLSAHIGEIRDCHSGCPIPKCVCDCVGGNVAANCSRGTPTVFASIGLFTVVQLIRNVQMLVPVYDFCIPEKTCCDSTDGPCDAFRKLQFPTDDFFPPRTADANGCSKCNDD